MVSHNMIDGVPMHGNHKLLTGVLRNRFGLQRGYIGSDEGNVFSLSQAFYGVATDAADSSVLWLESGGDQAMLDMCPGGAGGAPSTNATSPCNAATLVSESKLDQAVLDRAVGNILRTKFATGLFDDVGVPDRSVPPCAEKSGKKKGPK